MHPAPADIEGIGLISGASNGTVTGALTAIVTGDASRALTVIVTGDASRALTVIVTGDASSALTGAVAGHELKHDTSFGINIPVDRHPVACGSFNHFCEKHGRFIELWIVTYMDAQVIIQLKNTAAPFQQDRFGNNSNFSFIAVIAGNKERE